jgi:aldose 1-epimerase
MRTSVTLGEMSVHASPGPEASGPGGGTRLPDGRLTPEPPSGRQSHLAFADHDAWVTEVGATLRAFTVAGVPVIEGFDLAERSPIGRGQVLMPWPGRVGDGRYRFGGREHQLALTEPSLGNAIHGLVRWASWQAEPLSAARVVMRHRLFPQEGYPFCLDLEVAYELSGRGLTVTCTSTNRGASPAPFGAGFHPYLSLGAPRIDTCRLRVPAATVLLTDDRLLPVGRAAVGATELDFRASRPVGEARLNTAYTDLARDDEGVARVTLEAPDGRSLTLWADSAFPWVMLFTGDTAPRAEDRRHSLAVEPMTCPPDAFRSGEDLVTLEPGESVAARWGIDTTGFRR